MFLTPRLFFNASCRNAHKVLSSTNFQQSRTVTNENFIHKSKLPDVDIPQLLLHDYVFKGLDRWADKIALQCAETGRFYKYTDVYKASRSVAVFLRKKLQLQKSDCIAFLLPNVPEYAIGMLSAFHGNLKATTINPIYTKDEIKRQLIDSNAKVIFTLAELYQLAKCAANEVPNSTIEIVVIKQEKDESTPEGAIKFEEIAMGDYFVSWEHGDFEDVAILPYSSGTTGMPKGVQLTHKSVVSNLCQWLSPNIGILRETQSSHQDNIPSFLPMFHIYGIMVVTLSALSTGSKLITVPKFGSKILMKILTETPPDILFAVPPIILMLLNNPSFHLRHIEHIRTVVSSAAPLGAADIERFLDKSKGMVDFLQIYGMTEASPLILCQTKQCKGGVKTGGSGMLLSNSQAKIVNVDDPKNIGLGPMETGELIFKGPQIMKGYLNNSEATKKAIVDDGWLRTGDIAHFDEDGQFFITDRLKELIKVKGFQVAPAELEEILRDHPTVADAAVIGVPHSEFGEVPRAFVVPKKDSNLNADQLKEYVASKVAKYKQLYGGIIVLDSIPKTPSGKILRRQLKSMS